MKTRQKIGLTLATILIISAASTLSYRYGYNKAAWNTRAGDQPYHYTSQQIQTQINSMEYGVVTINVSALITDTIYVNKTGIGIETVNGAELIACCPYPLIIGHPDGIENIKVDVRINTNNVAEKGIIIYGVQHSDFNLEVFNALLYHDGIGISLETRYPHHSTAHNRFHIIEVWNMKVGIRFEGLYETSLVCNNAFTYLRTWDCNTGMEFVQWSDTNFFTRVELRTNKKHGYGIIYNSYNPLEFTGVYNNEMLSLVLELCLVQDGYGIVVGYTLCNTIRLVTPVIPKGHEYYWVNGVNPSALWFDGTYHGWVMEDYGIRYDMSSRWWTAFSPTFPTGSTPLVDVQSLNHTYQGEPVNVTVMNSNSTHFQVYMETNNGVEITDDVMAIWWYANLGY